MVIFSTIGGTTRKVAERVAARIGDAVVSDAQHALSTPPSREERCVLLFCPTYGDSEVEEQFERLLLGYDWSALSESTFAFCELGIYTGYEDFGHGLAPIVHAIMRRHGLRELVPSLALDAVPITDWALVDAWADLISSRLAHR